jgi:hypothetical protein
VAATPGESFQRVAITFVKSDKSATFLRLTLVKSVALAAGQERPGARCLLAFSFRLIQLVRKSICGFRLALIVRAEAIKQFEIPVAIEARLCRAFSLR